MPDLLPISALPLFRAAQDQQEEPPFWKRIADRANAVPAEERGVLPPDGAARVDDYLATDAQDRTADVGITVEYEGYRFSAPFLCMCCGAETTAQQWAYGRTCGLCDTGICQRDPALAHERPPWVRWRVRAMVLQSYAIHVGAVRIVPLEGVFTIPDRGGEREEERAALRAFNAAHPELAEPAAPYVRGSATSRAAAVAIDPHRETGEHLVRRLLLAAGERGATDLELQAACPHVRTIRPRRIRLMQDGEVQDSGQRRQTDKGRAAIVWVLTDKGRRVAQEGGT